ncbi:hypothetical protein PAPHI01_0576 [Pancytospora philotis]|nr:hypothetical protein PAPHI01_0576 [Pancytospora philotis]
MGRRSGFHCCLLVLVAALMTLPPLLFAVSMKMGLDAPMCFCASVALFVAMLFFICFWTLRAYRGKKKKVKLH